MSPHLVPITRELLRDFYSNYPLEPVPEEEHQACLKTIAGLSSAIGKTGSSVPEVIGMECPTRIDDCFWRNRMFCEEMAQTLKKIPRYSNSDDACNAKCGAMAAKLLDCERTINAVQIQNTEAAGKQVKRFLPQDFRGSLLEMKRNSTEKYYNKQVDDLVKKGGSIRDKYELYLQQQWERRESLAQMGELSGMFKFLVKHMGGIPQVLLDFAKQINAKLGPMEEQRIKYGPDLYKSTSLGIQVDVCVHLLRENMESLDTARLTAALDSVGTAVECYTHHTARVITFLGDLFEKSPFFVDANAVSAPALKEEADIVSSSPREAEDESGAMERHSVGLRGRSSVVSDTYLSCVDHSWADEHNEALKGFDHTQVDHTQEQSQQQSHESRPPDSTAAQQGSIAPSSKHNNGLEHEVAADARSGRDVSSAQSAPPVSKPKGGCFGCFGGSS